jgi:hypothetical protein
MKLRRGLPQKLELLGCKEIQAYIRGFKEGFLDPSKMLPKIYVGGLPQRLPARHGRG